ncbi:hypothetical protein EML15_06825 [Corynebacterium sp. sy017]|uniref:SAF domain-containing protein n=1 Tax=unclassified Corynebacterium TaxID=2624378 RepID=UPI0011861E4C|nr:MULTISPECIES: SAF domain-containing protein [unclassified Corynebacterium]MBP3088856.1 hypothetical protein [Corynebacterium sp. sy017]TSD91198.1 hypothetical protein ELY17_06835 [Corynebacterium sp. SY003]
MNLHFRFFEDLRNPGYRRSLALRRLLACSLVVLALCFAIQENRDDKATVIITTREIEAGHSLSARDITQIHIPHEFLPDNALSLPTEALGRISAHALPKGSMISQFNFISSDLTAHINKKHTVDADTESAEGAESAEEIEQFDERYNMVPINLADPTVAGLLVHGDTVSVISVNTDNGAHEEKVIATGAKVIFSANAQSDKKFAQPGTVLIALPEQEAQTVAAASLASPLTLIVTGERAQLS